MYTYWHQKIINGDRQCCPWALCSSCFDLFAPPSSFIRILHDTMLLTVGFDMFKKLWIQPWKAPLACNVMKTPTSVVRTTSMFRLNVYCDVKNFAPFLLLRHVGTDKHLFWSIATKVVPGLIWMRADMTVYHPGYSLYDLLRKKIQICNNIQ